MSVIKTRKLLFCVNKSIINGSNSLASWNLWECNYTFHLVCHFFFPCFLTMQFKWSKKSYVHVSKPSSFSHKQSNSGYEWKGMTSAVLLHVQSSCTCSSPAIHSPFTFLCLQKQFKRKICMQFNIFVFLWKKQEICMQISSDNIWWCWSVFFSFW